MLCGPHGDDLQVAVVVEDLGRLAGFELEALPNFAKNDNVELGKDGNDSHTDLRVARRWWNRLRQSILETLALHSQREPPLGESRDVIGDYHFLSRSRRVSSSS